MGYDTFPPGASEEVFQRDGDTKREVGLRAGPTSHPPAVAVGLSKIAKAVIRSRPTVLAGGSFGPTGVALVLEVASLGDYSVRHIRLEPGDRPDELRQELREAKEHGDWIVVENVGRAPTDMRQVLAHEAVNGLRNRHTRFFATVPATSPVRLEHFDRVLVSDASNRRAVEGSEAIYFESSVVEYKRIPGS
ncbi:MAG: hypothetical protein AB1758_12425 [Candidatus Eremiobacterota bacterium]